MYSKKLSSAEPGLIIICIDQSGSMEESYANGNKAQFAAMAVNRVIGEIIAACTAGNTIKDRCWIAVIGYGAKTELEFLNPASTLAENANTMVVKKKISDGAGGLVEVDEIMRVFVNPVANGGTPMADAFREAVQGATGFISKFPNSFPPVVINITDGEPYTGDSVEAAMQDARIEAEKLTQLKTSDGNVILMNAHISNAGAGKIELPSNKQGIGENVLAEFLYDISSVLPDNMVLGAQHAGFNVQQGQGARGFVFNAESETLIKLLNFGSNPSGLR
ncbi:MAG: VWA domain-containing protein [Candidatus Symbiothrix sp.]|jgi:hypothetical protein|nr:VWA domain-containing protein [Candidatus Symbiothrix sp.]